MGRVVDRPCCRPHASTNEGPSAGVPRRGANGGPTPGANGGAGQRATACRHHGKQRQAHYHTYKACYSHEVVLLLLQISLLHLLSGALPRSTTSRFSSST